MKKKLLTVAFALGLLTAFSLTSTAQEKKSVGKTIDKTATSVGNKTAEVAVKGTAKIGGKTWRGKMAPDGSNVYIDNKNRKYYVNKKGAKIYLKAAEIKTRPVKAS
jgi:hypothetical protein